MNEKELIDKVADAIQRRALWPSLHWPKLDAIQHRDVAVGLAMAALDVVEELLRPKPPGA